MSKHQTLPLASHRAGTVLFWLCWLVYFSAQLGRLDFSVALTGIVDSGFLPKSTAGLIGTSFYICYGCGQLISGFLGDRVNCYLLLFIGIAGSACANVAMSLTTGLAGMLILWGLNGFMQSLLWTPLLNLFATAMPEAQRTKACVNIATTTPLGMFACYLLSNWALSEFGWQPVFWVNAVPMFLAAAVLAFGAWRLTRRARLDDTPARRAVAEPELPKPAASEPKTGRLWPLLVMSGTLFMLLPIAVQSVLKDGMTTWTPTMLTETFSVEPTFAVTLTMLLPIPNLLGGYLGAWLNEKWLKNEMKTSALFFGLSFVCLVAMFFASSVSIWATVAALAVIVMSMHAINMMIITFVPVRFGKYGKTAMLSGILNCTAYIGGAISTYGIGWFAETLGWAPTILLWVGLCALVTLLCALMIPRWGRFRAENAAV